MATNIERAAAAIKALKVGTDYDEKVETDVLTYVGDLVANLKHLCDQERVAFDECLRIANNHFTAEVADDDSTKSGNQDEKNSTPAKRNKRKPRRSKAFQVIWGFLIDEQGESVASGYTEDLIERLRTAGIEVE